MHKSWLVLVLLIPLLFANGCINAAPEVAEFTPEEHSDPVDPVQSMKSLLDSIPAQREMGSAENAETVKILSDLLITYGFEVTLQELEFKLYNGGIAYRAEHSLKDREPESSGSSNNIIADTPFYDPGRQTVIICAHHDTYIFPGANDNGSGVAVLMELARTVKEPLRYNLRYILFAGEENMMFGSYAYVDSLTDEERKNIAAVINLDTLSGDREPQITFAAREYTPAYDLFKDIFQDNIAVNLNPDYSGGDESSFASRQIPALSIGQSGYEVIHSPKDTVENLDFDDLLVVYELLYRALTSL